MVQSLIKTFSPKLKSMCCFSDLQAPTIRDTVTEMATSEAISVMTLEAVELITAEAGKTWIGDRIRIVLSGLEAELTGLANQTLLRRQQLLKRRQLQQANTPLLNWVKVKQVKGLQGIN